MLKTEGEVSLNSPIIYTKEDKGENLEIDTIIGIVKTKNQYNYCIKKSIYYTYKKLLLVKAESIKYVGIYQTINSFGYEEAGVYLYGEVVEIYHVKRSDIHYNCVDSKKDEECVVFLVKEWLKLEQPIAPLGSTTILVETSIHKLLRARTYKDLMIY